ncbi:MAG: TetR/AcrR family transcriptional regulator [Woeseiaceae bacterium]
MPEPRYQRRKEDRPAEIAEAAMQTFAEKGYAATKVEEVARRAGVSKGLLYLYFKTKEELFKAVVRNFVSPHLDSLVDITESSDLSATGFLNGPFLEFAKTVPKSPARRLILLMVAEGHKHPDLVEWYWKNVVSRGISTLKTVIDKGVENGEFRPSTLQDFPHLLVSPVLFSTVFTNLFEPHANLDTDRFIEAHVELMLNSIKA